MLAASAATEPRTRATSDVVRNPAVELPEWKVDDCGRRQAQGDVVGISHQPDDLDLSRLAAHAGRETLTDGIGPGEILVRERFVHDHHRLAAGSIALVEVAAGDQARLHGVEEARTGAHDEGRVSLRQWFASANEGLAPRRSVERRVRRQACRQDIRHALHGLDEFLQTAPAIGCRSRRPARRRPRILDRAAAGSAACERRGRRRPGRRGRARPAC